jgi:hypothetical protein
MTPEQELMAKIKTTCGPWIDAAVEGTTYPPALLAALTANESGGDLKAQRFEAKVFGQLAQVLVGHKANFGAIGGEDLLDAIGIVTDAKTIVLQLMTFATSYGPTQIMGYQALAGKYDMADLSGLTTHYHRAVAMLDDFCKRFDLLSAPAPNWGAYFHCWNAGSPAAPTFDPNYTWRGLDRMNTYGTL